MNRIKIGSGIYMLYDNDTLVYIGKSKTDIYQRLLTHIRNGKIHFDSVKYKVIKNMSDIDILELVLIHKYKPIYNIDLKNNDTPTIVIKIDKKIEESMNKYSFDELYNEANGIISVSKMLLTRKKEQDNDFDLD